MQALLAQIVRLARSMVPVAITGESCGGKKPVVHYIHSISPRADKPFVAVNCGAIPEALMEVEFFGYQKGRFTGDAAGDAGTALTQSRRGHGRGDRCAFD